MKFGNVTLAQRTGMWGMRRARAVNGRRGGEAGQEGVATREAAEARGAADSEVARAGEGEVLEGGRVAEDEPDLSRLSQFPLLRACNTNHMRLYNTNNSQHNSQYDPVRVC